VNTVRGRGLGHTLLNMLYLLEVHVSSLNVTNTLLVPALLLLPLQHTHPWSVQKCLCMIPCPPGIHIFATSTASLLPFFFFAGFAPLRIDRDTYLGTPFVVIREGVPEPFILKGRLDSSTPRVIAVVILAPDLVRRACPRPYRLSSCKKVC